MRGDGERLNSCKRNTDSFYLVVFSSGDYRRPEKWLPDIMNICVVGRAWCIFRSAVRLVLFKAI